MDTASLATVLKKTAHLQLWILAGVAGAPDFSLEWVLGKPASAQARPCSRFKREDKAGL